MVSNIIEVLIGVWFTLIGFGKVKVSKNPAVNAAFRLKFGKFFRIAGPVMIIIAIVLFLHGR